MKIQFEKDERGRTARKLDFKRINEEVHRNTAKVIPPKEVRIDLQNSYELNMKGFISKFSNISSMNDEELINFVRITYLDVLEASNINPIKIDEDTVLGLYEILTNPKFLDAMKKIIVSCPLDFAHTVYLNNLIYEYLIQPDMSSIDPTSKIVRELYVQLGQISNIRLITTLNSCNIDKSLATTIAIAAGSSFDDFSRVKRVNKVIVSTPYNYSIQTIVDIYQHTFGQCVTKLFVATMFQLFDKTQMTQQQIYTNNLIDQALLILLDNMPSYSMKMVLTNYANYCMGNNKYVRFSMNTLCEKHPRIHQVIVQLNQEQVFMP